MSEPIQQLERGHDQLGAAVEGWLAQAVDERLIVEAAESLLAQRRPGTVPDQTLQAVSVPVRDRDRGVDRPAAGMAGRYAGGVQCVYRRTVQAAVSLQPAQTAFADLRLDCLEVGNIEVTGGMEDGPILPVSTEQTGGVTPALSPDPSTRFEKSGRWGRDV